MAYAQIDSPGGSTGTKVMYLYNCLVEVSDCITISHITLHTTTQMEENICKLESVPMPNVMAALRNTGGALCSNAAKFG